MPWLYFICKKIKCRSEVSRGVKTNFVVGFFADSVSSCLDSMDWREVRRWCKTVYRLVVVGQSHVVARSRCPTTPDGAVLVNHVWLAFLLAPAPDWSHLSYWHLMNHDATVGFLFDKKKTFINLFLIMGPKCELILVFSLRCWWSETSNGRSIAQLMG